MQFSLPHFKMALFLQQIKQLMETTKWTFLVHHVLTQKLKNSLGGKLIWERSITLQEWRSQIEEIAAAKDWRISMPLSIANCKSECIFFYKRLIYKEFENSHWSMRKERPNIIWTLVAFNDCYLIIHLRKKS